MPQYFKGLNSSQKKAVLHNEGPLLVLAGAGSGKTRVLTTRIARLVGEKLCWPSEILAVTFTNKAAREMRDRIASVVSPQAAQAMTIATFHSFGAKVLREHGKELGLKSNYTILDDHERTATLKSIMRTSGKSMQKEDINEFATRISLLKNASLDPEACTQDETVTTKQKKVYTAYRDVLSKRQSVDFDDLLLLPLRLFEKSAAILRTYQRKYRFVCIDEYQDTNAVQMKLAALLAAPQNNLMVVGDDDQSIYSWRGANSSNILSFSKKFKGCTTVILDHNYRSTRQILEGAHAVVQKNQDRTVKHIVAAKGDGDPIEHYRADDEVDEAVFVAKTIADDVRHEKCSHSDFALLMRTNAMMRRFEEELRVQNIPYRVVGGMSFFDRKEIKDILAYMRFFSNPSNELSLSRVIKVPDRGITKSTFREIDELAVHRRTTLWEALKRHAGCDRILTSQHEKCERFALWAGRHLDALAAGERPSTVIRSALAQAKYVEGLRKAYKDEKEGADRVRNVEEMLHGLELYEQRRRKPGLEAYLQEVSLKANDKEDDEKRGKGVSLLTIHKSKGLEFPVVILPGLDDSVFPSPRAVEEGQAAEERRLFYVAMTRAQKRLILTWPNTKSLRGKDKKVTPCRFIFEIPEEFLDGPLGQKSDEEYNHYVTGFFKDVQQKLAQAQVPVPE